MVPSACWTPRVRLSSSEKGVLSQGVWRNVWQGEIGDVFARNGCFSQSQELLAETGKLMNHQPQDTELQFLKCNKDQRILATTSPGPVLSSPCHDEIHPKTRMLWPTGNTFCLNLHGAERGSKNPHPPDIPQVRETLPESSFQLCYGCFRKVHSFNCFPWIQGELDCKSQLLIPVGTWEERLAQSILWEAQDP